MNNIIEVKNLSKTFGKFKAVDNINFNVIEGELFGFLGVNGAGKSTTINMLSTLLKNSSGEAEICGLKLGKDNEEIRKRIGIVFQNNSLDDLLTVKENLIFRGYLYDDDKNKIQKNLDMVCEILKIGDYLNKQFRYLSGGQKRSCDIARAIMNKPQILFLDEPTTGLDPKTRKNLWECIEYLRKENNMTVFLTTHYMEEAAKAKNIAIIDKGRIVALGSPFKLKEEFACDQLKLEPKDAGEVKKILDINRLEYVEEGNRINVTIPHTLYSIEILKNIEKYIKSFEVVQGTLEDVFLNITGRTLIQN